MWSDSSPYPSTPLWFVAVTIGSRAQFDTVVPKEGAKCQWFELADRIFVTMWRAFGWLQLFAFWIPSQFRLQLRMTIIPKHHKLNRLLNVFDDNKKTSETQNQNFLDCFQKFVVCDVCGFMRWHTMTRRLRVGAVNRNSFLNNVTWVALNPKIRIQNKTPNLVLFPIETSGSCKRDTVFT